MPSDALDRGVALSLADRANARIRDMLTTARDEVRPLTPDERAEYERLRAVYVEAVAAA